MTGGHLVGCVFGCDFGVGPKLEFRAVDAGHMAVPHIDLVPPESPSTASAEAQAARQGRMGSIGRAAVLGWYLAIGLAAWADTLMTGQPAALLAACLVGGSITAFVWAGGMNMERLMLRGLLVGLIGLAAGAFACAGSPPGSEAAAEFLCFGAMAMLFGVLAALPPALMAALRHA